MKRTALVMLGLIVLLALFGPWLSPYDGAEQDRMNALGPPSAHHLLGTDNFGRDELTRVLIATRVSLIAGCLAAGLTLLTGVILGALAGFYSGWRDRVLSGSSELFLSLPWFYLLIGIRALLPLRLPASVAVMMIGVIGGLTAWPRTFRMVRGVTLSERERDYVGAARAFGAADLYLLRRHILPAFRSVVLVQASLLIPQFILAEATLSFLGLGVGEPAASLGSMLMALRDPSVLTTYPWMLAPAVVLILLAASCRAASEAVH